MQAYEEELEEVDASIERLERELKQIEANAPGRVRHSRSLLPHLAPDFLMQAIC